MGEEEAGSKAAALLVVRAASAWCNKVWQLCRLLLLAHGGRWRRGRTSGRG